MNGIRLCLAWEPSGGDWQIIPREYDAHCNGVVLLPLKKDGNIQSSVERSLMPLKYWRSGSKGVSQKVQHLCTALQIWASKLVRKTCLGWDPWILWDEILIKSDGNRVLSVSLREHWGGIRRLVNGCCFSYSSLNSLKFYCALVFKLLSHALSSFCFTTSLWSR